MKQRSWIFVLVIVACALVGGGLAMRKRSSPVLDADAEAKNIEMRFARDGELRALRYIEKRYVSYQPLTAKAVAQTVGRLLFQYKKQQGLTLCQQPFRYGCFEGFFAAAAAERLDGQEGEFEKLCGAGESPPAAAWGECVHVYGQTQIAVRGATADGLAGSIASCDRFSSQEGNRGCANGAFTRYFSTRPTQIPAETVRHGGCDDVPPQHREACLFELPFLWSRVYGGEYATMWELCAASRADRDRTACSRGIGHMLTVVSGFNTATIGAACQRAPTGEDASLCIAEAVRYLVFEKREGTEELCQQLPEALRDQCRQEARRHSCRLYGICS